MRPKNRTGFTIAIICALPLEADAVEALFDELYDRFGTVYGKQPGDANTYITGRIGKQNIVLCSMPGMGKGSAASVASSLRISYPKVQIALIVGICGGAPYPSGEGYEEIFLGDVIISDSVIDYDFGSQYPGGFKRKTGARDTMGRPNREIRGLLAALKGTGARRDFRKEILEHLHTMQEEESRWQSPGSVEDVLFQASYIHKHYGGTSTRLCACRELIDGTCDDALNSSCNRLRCEESQIIRRRDYTEDSLSVHIGAVASADTVMKSGVHRDHIAKDEGVIGFEMEGAGVCDNTPYVIIKAVCDYADSHKSKQWQAYAAAVGASAAKAFLGYWGVPAVEDQHYHWMVPFARNPHFVGREDEIAKIATLIMRENGPRKVAICGLGGVGKTQIALELAYRIRNMNTECSIFWIPCTSPESVEQAYLNIALALDVITTHTTEAKEKVRDHLSQKDAGNWLLILDNADDMNMWTKGTHARALTDFLPQSEQGHIVFTTRSRKVAVELVSFHVILISEPDIASAVEILRSSLIEESLVDDTDITTTLLQQLAFLPLAISQAAAYINQNNITLREYIELLDEQESDVIKLLGKDFGNEGRYREIQNLVASTWFISFQQIQHLDQLAADYLSFMACISPRNIPHSLLPEPSSQLQKIEALGILKAFSFISEDTTDRSLNIHRLVHLATRNWLRQNQQFSLQIWKVANRLNEVFPDRDESNRKLWRKYLPHALALIVESDFKIKQDYFDLVGNIGDCLYVDGRYEDAKDIQEQLVKDHKRIFGPKHQNTRHIMSCLAGSYWSLGLYRQAEELALQIVETDKQEYGLESHRTLTVQVLDTRKRVLGPEHHGTASSMILMADICHDQGQFNETEQLAISALEIQQKALGAKHPSVLGTMSRLAWTWKELGKNQDALDLMEECLRLSLEVLRPEHPDTIYNLKILNRWKQGDDI
ncbi:purine and uridine phosphorylase [Aspergillus californicus]